MDRKSQVQCLADCRKVLAKGASVLFFPEGTRSLDARLGTFKKGAFTVAARAKVSLCAECWLSARQAAGYAQLPPSTELCPGLLQLRLQGSCCIPVLSIIACVDPLLPQHDTLAWVLQVPVVPITLMGTGDIMPSQQESHMYPGHVHVIIHPPVAPASAEQMLNSSRKAIASAMPPHLVDHHAGQ